MSKLWIEENGTAAFYQEIAPAVNYEDKSNDVVSWENSYKKIGFNYYHFLKKLQTILIVKGSSTFNPLVFDLINNLSLEEKSIAVKYWVMQNPADRIGSEDWQVTDAQDSENVKSLLKLSKKARHLIIELIREKIGDHMRVGNINLDQSRRFFRIASSWVEDYINTSDPIFKAYMTSASVTVDGVIDDFTGSGFIEESFSTQSILDDCMAIYNGTHY